MASQCLESGYNSINLWVNFINSHGFNEMKIGKRNIPYFLNPSTDRLKSFFPKHDGEFSFQGFPAISQEQTGHLIHCARIQVFALICNMMLANLDSNAIKRFIVQRIHYLFDLFLDLFFGRKTFVINTFPMKFITGHAPDDLWE